MALLKNKILNQIIRKVLVMIYAYPLNAKHKISSAEPCIHSTNAYAFDVKALIRNLPSQ